MRILLAPDSYKNSMCSVRAARTMADAVRSEMPEAQVDIAPMSDGGEGLMEAVRVAKGGERRKVVVHDPLGRLITSGFAVLPCGETAVVEMAAASGLELLAPRERDALKTTSYGTGELIRAALEDGYRDVIVGIGGSATVDGGLGMAQALGYRFFNKQAELIENFAGGGQLSQVHNCETENVYPALKHANVSVASDVTNPLLGTQGAAPVYGPQKGASPQAVEDLACGLQNFSALCCRQGLVREVDQPGSGAAGGLGFGLRTFCGARILSGARLVATLNNLYQRMEQADLCITGEGCTDRQTLSGKVCQVVGEIASEYTVPVILLSGAVEDDCDAELPASVRVVFSVLRGPATLTEALRNGEENLWYTVRNVIRASRLQI